MFITKICIIDDSIKCVHYLHCRSLFKADRLMFALHMVHGMFPDRFQEKEWDLFSGLIVSDIKTDGHKHERDLPQWLDQDRTTAVSLLKSTLPQVYQSLCLTVSFYSPCAYAISPTQ